ncbi:MAG: ABC transporter substrate-binding protein [Rhodospirillales bacterium]|nr:ABC transporter substrate-binding protein [Rhodospirillales bacterium]
MKLLFGILAGTALITATFAGNALADGKLNFVSFGGGYTDSQKKAFVDPFRKETGITVNIEDYTGGLGEIRAQVEAGNVAWDVVDVELQDLVRGCDEGLFERVDNVKLPNSPNGVSPADDYLSGTLHECGVGSIVWSNVLAYNNNAFPNAKPTKVEDFFDTKKFAGKRGAQKKPQVMMEWALIADGVPAGDVYKVLATRAGVDRAFAKLDTIKKDIVWWETHAQAPQLLADGEVSMTVTANGRMYGAIVDEGQPFTVIWDRQIWNLDLWAIPKGSKDADLARKFISFAARPDRMADQTNYISYGPVRRSAAELIAPKMKPYMPTTAKNFNNAIANDFEFWASYNDELSERFNAWLAK